ncbi:uncharacterized protein A4U43_C08F9750 [Asparagus officinalis]|nr:uncharacterized protein A4U43_C08F9750 [Asparagus officinalis]
MISLAKYTTATVNPPQERSRFLIKGASLAKTGRKTRTRGDSLDDEIIVKQSSSSIQSSKRERARRRKGQTLRPTGNEQRRNDKMRCPGTPYRKKGRRFWACSFPAPPSSSGACLGGVAPEIGLEALALPTSRLLMAVGHDYYKKVKMNLPILHGGVCIFMLGVLLSCDPVLMCDLWPRLYLFRAAA